MKELSIEQKAKAYDEAIKKAESLYKVSEPMSGCNVIIETLFPELKESEDEKTKRILHSISSKISFHLRDIFTEEEFQCFDAWSNAWLKKQEQKPADKEMKRVLQTEYEKGRADAISEMQKSWSEEDENRINRLIAYFEDKESFTAEDDVEYANWLKSLSPQSRWKPSNEQMNAFDAILVYNPPCSNECRNHLITLYNELKKLKGE